MIRTSARLLRLLSLLSVRPSWTCVELAERLEITERTVRRDIARLRELGYGIESDAGPWGGYRLGPGANMPPLLLDDDEALSVLVGLRAATLSGVAGSEQAALSALLKLRQVVPTRISNRLGELDAVLAHAPGLAERRISSALLLDLAATCRRGERVRLSYRDRRGTSSTRDVDPYRLVYTGRRWYFVAHDVSRQGWRTFRADRIVDAKPTGRRVEFTDPPDPTDLVARGIALAPYPTRVTIRLVMSADEARRLIPPTVGTHRPDGNHATIVEIGGPDADGLAKYLLSLGADLEILDSEDVRQAFLRRAKRLLEANR